MRSMFLLCGLALFLSVGIAYSVKSQEAPAGTWSNVPEWGATPQQRIEFYEKEMKKCYDYLDELSIGINKAKILFDNAKATNPHPFSGYGWSVQIDKFEEEVKWVCLRIKWHRESIQEQMDKVPPAPSPTPTPNPGPSPSPPNTETKSGQSSDPLKNKQFRDFNAEIKSVNEYRQKFDKVKAGANKILKDINDYVKKNMPQTIYKVVINHEGAYSIWPADRENSLGWDDAGKTGTKEECLAYIKEVVANPVIPGPGKISIPSQAQNGRNLELTGSFDGNAKTTAVTIDGQRVEVLEETARKSVFTIPNNLKGRVKVTVEEGSNKAEGTCNVINVKVTATQTNLRKGQRAVVTVGVEGLPEIKSPVPLQVVSTGVIKADGGNVRHLWIRQADIQPGGRFTFVFEIVGTQDGVFNVTATVITQPSYITLAKDAKDNGWRAKKGGDGFVFIIENVKDPLKGGLLEGEYVLETGCLPGTQIKSLIPVLVKKGQAEVDYKALEMICKDRFNDNWQLASNVRF